MIENEILRAKQTIIEKERTLAECISLLLLRTYLLGTAETAKATATHTVYHE